MHCEIYTTKKTKFSIKDFFSKCAFGIADLVTFTKEILNGKLHFLCSDITTTSSKNIWVKFITYEKNNFFWRIQFYKEISWKYQRACEGLALEEVSYEYVIFPQLNRTLKWCVRKLVVNNISIIKISLYERFINDY